MSAEAMGWVFRHSPFSGGTFLVHLSVADVVNDVHGNEFWMAQEALAAKARVSRRTAQRALDELIEGGFLTLLEQNAKAGKPNRYRFEVRHGDAPGASSDDIEVRHGDAQNSIEPKENSNTSRGEVVDLPFESFWKLYPRKIGKPAAKTKWRTKTRGVDLEILMSGLNAWSRYWATRDEPEFVPHPATWLNREQWNDTPPLVTRHPSFPREY